MPGASSKPTPQDPTFASHDMSEPTQLRRTDFYCANDSAACRVETRGGTIYWMGEADDDGFRPVVRDQLPATGTDTMVLQTISQSKKPFELTGSFRGRLAGDVQEGLPFVLEIPDHRVRILSEIVVEIDVGTLPEEIEEMLE